MPDLMMGTSGYATGSIDTATVLVSNVSPISARHPNGIAAGVIQIEQVLGSGTVLRGSTADLATRLAVGMNPDGLLKLGTDGSIIGPLNPVKGGTGLTGSPAGTFLLSEVANIWIAKRPTGFLFTGPTSIGAGSTIAHGGSQTLTSQAYDGLHFYTDVTLSTGQTLTLGNNSHRAIIIASSSITINGTIDAVGAGSTGGSRGSAAGAPGLPGFTQPGGGGGGSSSESGADGGGIYTHSILIQAGGVGGIADGAGAAGTSITGTNFIIDNVYAIMGGAGGGGGVDDSGTAGSGGRGGGSIVLIAPTVILGAASGLNTSGAVGGSATGDNGNGGGGGAGNIYIFCQTYTNNGCTFTLAGGVGGFGGNNAGGNGASGVRQILIYGNV